MTKKDITRLAQVLKDSSPMPHGWKDSDEAETVIHVWRNTVEMIAGTLKHDNPRFDRDRFLVACGYKN